ncbi:MAG: hypothetical protein QM523_01320 [Candidatus Pacebacteria bacterium]|nr:hypothetical protein [Candidatus Paceibacterota bacterium]
MKFSMTLLLLALLAFPLAACGLRGPPTPPAGADVTWPGNYPAE